MNNFAAIDFETANNERTSVCSVIRLAPRNNLSHQRNQPALARYRFSLGRKRITKFQIRFQMSSNRWALLYRKYGLAHFVLLSMLFGRYPKLH